MGYYKWVKDKKITKKELKTLNPGDEIFCELYNRGKIFFNRVVTIVDKRDNNLSVKREENPEYDGVWKISLEHPEKDIQSGYLQKIYHCHRDPQRIVNSANEMLELIDSALDFMQNESCQDWDTLVFAKKGNKARVEITELDRTKVFIITVKEE